MPATKSAPLLSPPLIRVMRTGIDADAPITRDYQGKALRRDAWQWLINRKLMHWLIDPSQLGDDGVEPPSRTIVRLAIDLAERFRDDGFPPPDSVVTDPNGGIVFERREGAVSEVFHVWEDGTVEYQRFHGSHLEERTLLP